MPKLHVFVIGAKIKTGPAAPRQGARQKKNKCKKSQHVHVGSNVASDHRWLQGRARKKAGVLIHSARCSLPEIAGMRKGAKKENPAKIMEKRQKKGRPKAPPSQLIGVGFYQKKNPPTETIFAS
jgi:hypothetical protein